LLALLALLASLLLLASALLLTFLALLLASTASKATDESLSLVGYSSHGVLHPLDGLPGLVGYLARGILRSSATTLGLGGAGLLDGLLGLGGRRNLQVEEAPIRTELQADEGPGLVFDGAGRLSLLVGGPLGALCTREVSDVAHYLLGDRVALLIDGLHDDVALFVDGALDGLSLFVGGGLAEQLGTWGEVLGDLGGLVDCLTSSILNLSGGLSRGVLHSLGGLPYLVGNPSEGAALSLLTALLVLVSFAHLFSLRHSKNYRLVRSEPGSDALHGLIVALYQLNILPDARAG
jgi:hypothetical protein